MPRVRALVLLVLSAVAAVFPAAADCELDFSPPVEYPAGDTPASIAVADFNNDGRPDLATRAGFTQFITVLLASGGGGFLPPVQVPMGRDLHADIAAGDVDGDGNADLLASSPSAGPSVPSALNVAHGNGDGTFQTAIAHEIPEDMGGLAVGDFATSGIGAVDVAATKTGGWVLFSDFGNGLSQVEDNDLPVNVQATPDALAAGDFNNDGNLDIAVSYSATGNVYVYYNSGGGSFNAGPVLPIEHPYRADALTAGDFDGDGDDDLAFGEVDPGATAGTKQLVIYPSKDSSTFWPPVRYGDLGLSGSIDHAASVDLDADGDADILLASASSVEVFLNDGTGAFPLQRTFSGYSHGFAVADLDDNGGPDLAGSDQEATGHVRVLYNVCALPPFGAPANAVASGAGGVLRVTWEGTRGVDHYQIWCRTDVSTRRYVHVGNSVTWSFVHPSPNAIYYCRVRGVSGPALSPYSNSDLTSTFVFTDPALTPGVTRIKRVHLTQLRNAIAAMYTTMVFYGTPTWTEASPVTVKAAEWLEVKTALDTILSAAGLPPVSYTAPMPAAGAPVSGALIEQIRANLD
ncbi:MAG TPA: VCBS repeat-containing protein [Thermoanaerobaculia bacterium]|nr:VCBS repeat-containing protein [Thermoanaerobaculia bacterium]